VRHFVCADVTRQFNAAVYIDEASNEALREQTVAMNFARRAGALLLGMMAAGAAKAAEPVPWGLGLQPAASPVMRDIHVFHDWLLLPIITVVTIIVMALLAYVMVKFNAKANPTPAKFTHNVLVEVIWTAIPILILIVIAIPSFRLLYKEDVTPANVDLTVKVTGHQWYWSYEYPDQEGIAFQSLMLTKEEAEAAGKPYLLATDTQVVVPVNKVVRLQITAADVIHSWALPALGVKMDAVPGRLNEAWFKAEREGTFYGQCSEICGIKHAFMPIEVKVVSQAEFDAWVSQQQTASLGAPTRLASAQ
jgi:cytochrome c oxidase subunit 2